FFFFSSRRRHTRSKRDWSSDVCSSDLGHGATVRAFAPASPARYRGARCLTPLIPPAPTAPARPAAADAVAGAAVAVAGRAARPEIGRASCRERVESAGVAGGAGEGGAE